MEGLVKKNRPQGRSVAYTMLKDAIQYLELMPGSILVEGELIERMGLGRTPIREALIRLSEEMLVNIFPQSGTYVAPISFELAREVAYMRHLLDRDVCLTLCAKKTKLREQVDEQFYFMRSAIKRHDVAEYIRQDNNLHGVIFKIAGHEMIWNIISNSRAHYNRVLMLDLQRDGKLDDSFQEHEELVECIESGNRKRLDEILGHHHDHNPNSEFIEEIRRKKPEYFPA
ncbi:MAG: GntR family transcriptional regulator [Planctomycetaceae bacterium]|nr:GntR family transcriptional regulator [Planctomycetaceae bacterium]